jgi:hypothetical protein
MKTTAPKPTDIRKMAEKYRDIRLSQPSISLSEMQAQLVRNRSSEGDKLRVSSSKPS